MSTVSLPAGTGPVPGTPGAPARAQRRAARRWYRQPALMAGIIITGLIVIALVFVLGPGERSIYIAITAVGWVSYARIVRGEILVAKRQEYVLAAQAGGLSSIRIMGRHLLPNVISQAFIYGMSDIVQDIL